MTRPASSANRRLPPTGHASRIAAHEIPRGFQFAAGACGLKKTGGLDLALFTADELATVAAVFTTNLVKASPVLLSQEHLRRSRGRMRAIVVNSGNANCSTGKVGPRASRATAQAVARELGCKPEEVFVCSTGVIGVPLPVEKILAALSQLAAGRSASADAYRQVTHAIMTTDTRPKCAAAQCRIGGKTVRLVGCAKGAGMIHPHMATMLAFVLTDAAIAAPLLQRAVREVAARTFNRITVDGDTSTNDTLAVFASGSSGAPLLTRHSPALSEVEGPLATSHSKHSGDYPRFVAALEKVCKSLALQIVADGEGAQRVVEINVRGARSEREAEQVAQTIANSPLVKTALAGADPNWGRILAAAGRSGVKFDPDRATIWLAGIKVYARGRALDFDETVAHNKMAVAFVPIRVDLGARAQRTRKVKEGRRKSIHYPLSTIHSATIWTCDFTSQYVDINASYRT